MMSRQALQKTLRYGRWAMLSLLVIAIGATAFLYGRWLYREQHWNKLIQEIAQRQNVDAALVKAVIRRESKFDPFVHGSHGEIGLMQVTEGAGLDWARATGRKDFGRDLLWDPRVNIEVGTWYLARALRRWQAMDDPVPFALAEYNAGLGNVLRWLPRGRDTNAQVFVEAITYPTVRFYINSVTEFYAEYKAAGSL